MLAAPDFDMVPAGYRDDLLVCLGPAGQPASAEDVDAAACRLASGVVELVESNTGTFAPLLPKQPAASQTDGSLRRYVAPLVA